MILGPYWSEWMCCEDCLEHPWLVECCERRRIRRLRAEGRTSLGGASLPPGVGNAMLKVILGYFG